MQRSTTLSALSPDHLVLITRRLDIADITRVAKLSGDSVLFRKCCLAGGVVQAQIGEKKALVALCLPSSPILTIFSHLTQLCIESNAFQQYPQALFGIGPSLPKTLTNIFVRNSCALNMWLRPINSTADPISIKNLSVFDGFVPMSMEDAFPRLEVLDLESNQCFHAEWHLPAIDYFISHMPASLTSLDFSECSLMLPTRTTGLLPTKLTQLSHFGCFLSTTTLSLSSCLRKTTNQLDDYKDIDTSAEESLTSLTFSSFLFHSSLQPLLTLTNLHSLIISVESTEFGIIPLPPNLTSLFMTITNRFDAFATFTATPQLVTLGINIPMEESAPEPPKLDYLPASLQWLRFESWEVALTAPLPDSLTYIEVIAHPPIMANNKKIDVSSLSHLKTLKISSNLLKFGDAPFPASVTSLRLGRWTSLSSLEIIPENLQNLSLHVRITPESVTTFLASKEWTTISFKARLLNLYPHLATARSFEVFFTFENLRNWNVYGECLEVIDESPFFDISLLSYLAPRPSSSLKIIRSPQNALPFNTNLLPSVLEELVIKRLKIDELSSPSHLPSTLQHLHIRHHAMYPESNDILHQITHLSSLRTLQLDEWYSTTPFASIESFFPHLTTLNVSFVNPLASWPPSLAIVLPNLKNLSVSRTLLPLYCLLDSLPNLDSLILPESVVIDSSIFPVIDPRVTSLDSFEIYELLVTALLPPRLRPTDDIVEFCVDWDLVSLSRLPSSLTKLNIKLVNATHFGLASATRTDSTWNFFDQRERIGVKLASFQHLKSLTLYLEVDDDVKFEKGVLPTLLCSCPPSLTSLELYGSGTAFLQSLSIITLLPATLQRLFIEIVDLHGLLTQRELFAALPAGLLHLRLFISLMIDLTIDDFKAFPASLQTLDLPTATLVLGEDLTKGAFSSTSKQLIAATLNQLQYIFTLSAAIAIHA